MDLSERHEVRETSSAILYTGKTYNSIENIGQFFAERGMKVPAACGGPKPRRKRPAGRVAAARLPRERPQPSMRSQRGSGIDGAAS